MELIRPAIRLVELGEQPLLSPLIAGDLLLIATQEPVEPPQRSALCAFSLADGSRRWQQPFDYALVSGLETCQVLETWQVLASLSSTDVLRGHGALLALSASGQELWRWSPDVQRVSAPAVAGDVLYVTADTRTLYALDLETGAEKGKAELPASASLSALVVESGVAYIPCRGPHLLAVSLEGKLLWRFTLKDSPDAWLDKTPVLAHQNVYAVSSQGAVVAVRASDGTQVWQVQVGPMGRPLSAPVTDGERLRLAVGARDGVYALDLADGREAWAFHTERRIEAAPVVASGVVYVTCHDRHLYALDAATGRKLWQHETARRIEVAPVLAACGEPARPCIVVADHGGTLVALERPLGAQEHEQAGHWGEAASVYADLGQHARGAELLQTHGEPFKAAELWKAAGDLERAAGQYQAAGAWLQAAEIWQALGQPLRQAEALEQHARSLQASPHNDEERAQAWHIAAQAFDNVGEAERAAACQCEIARLRRLPCIRVQVHTPDVMRLNESYALTFELTNVGGGVARQVLLRHTESEFAGDLKRTQHIRNVMPGQSISEVLSLRALVAGTVSLQVSADYADEAGHTYETRHRLRVLVRRPAKGEDGTGLTDLQVRIFARETKGYPVELTLDGEQVFERGYLSDDILPWHSESTPAQDGRRLFERLLADINLREAWGKVRGQSPRCRVRLWIDVGAPELHAVPWESLREGDLVLSASAETPFSRYLPIAKPWGGPVMERPIRVLVAISNPSDLADRYNLPPADVEPERQTLEAAFAAVGRDKLAWEFLPSPVTLERLEDALRHLHVLHLVCHGAFNAKQGQAALYLQDASGKAHRVLDEQLAGLLAHQGVQPRLVFLSACQSATRSQADAFLGLAPKLVSIGVPAIVAMQDAVTITSAREFSARFYKRLLEHGQVDLAMNEARNTLLTAGRSDAAVPVLFMRLKSGRLWAEEDLSDTPNLPES